ncbi:MAG: ABC transporter ATP-binding protein [Acidimicrobiia bacterium]
MISAPMLNVDSVSIHFGSVRACDGIDLAIGAGEVVGIIGPNGSGKTTLLRGIAGHQRLTDGRVVFRGDDVTGHATDRLARSGLVMTSQNQMVFPGVRVDEALELAKACSPRREHSARSVDAVELLRIESVLQVLVGELPLGRLRMVGIALALMAEPALLLLDEPGAGLNDEESSVLADAIRNLCSSGITVGIVDHDMSLMTAICDRVYVLDAGQNLRSGRTGDVLSDPVVVAAYLGNPIETSAS